MELTTKKILIIEDDVEILNVLCDRLTREDFDVLKAKDGKEGLSIALAEHPDLILLDIIMPGMNGLTMLQELKKDEWGKDAAVIMLTNLGQGEDMDEVKQLDVVDYLVKSDWNINEVVSKVRAHFIKKNS